MYVCMYVCVCLYTGRATFDKWMALIDERQWPEFVAILLESHYDPAYYRSQRKHAEKYEPPSLSVALASPAEAHLDQSVMGCKAACDTLGGGGGGGEGGGGGGGGGGVGVGGGGEETGGLAGSGAPDASAC